MTEALPDYSNLDLSGEAQAAAARMEARSQEPASQAMFTHLVAPLLTAGVRRVLEFGCGTAGLARRIARAAPWAEVAATDKSTGMLTVARQQVEAESIPNLQLHPWDVLDEGAFPLPGAQFDLIVSSVVIPYFDEAQALGLIARLAARLAPGGVLAFVEQDWGSDSLYFPGDALSWAVLNKAARQSKRTLGLGLRPVLREAGLEVLPRRSFLWTDDRYGPYTRDLLERFADAACDQGRITAEERDEWKRTLRDLAAAGDFYYGIVYHCVAGRKPLPGLAR